MSNKLKVTLTGGGNEYLKYPVNGILELFEIGIHHEIISAVFRVARPEGIGISYGAPVRVAAPQFVYPQQKNQKV